MRGYILKPNRHLIEFEKKPKSDKMRIKGTQIGLTDWITTKKLPPQEAPKYRLHASEAEGFEGIIDRMVQGTFNSVDNEIEKQEFVELDKAALEMNEDLNETKITKKSIKLV